MPSEKEREYYRMGYADGIKDARRDIGKDFGLTGPRGTTGAAYTKYRKGKKKLSAWQKFIRLNKNKPRFKLRSGKLNLKKMGVAYRKTAAYKRNKKK